MKRRGGKRIKQTLYITEDTRTLLEKFGEVHGLNLSESAESLMLLGLQDTKSLGLAELMTATVRREVGRQYNRFAKLSAMAAIEAGAAKEMMMSIYWYLMLSEYANYEEGLAKNELPSFAEFDAMFSVEAQSNIGEIVGGMMKKRSERAQKRSTESLLNNLEFFDDLMHEISELGADPETRNLL